MALENPGYGGSGVPAPPPFPWTNLGGNIGLSQPGVITPYAPPGNSWSSQVNYQPTPSAIRPPSYAPSAPTAPRQGYGGYGGGGYGGGGDPYGSLGLPQAWLDWFPKVYGDFNAYYDAEGRGGPKQAGQDYYNFSNMWSNRSGRPMQNEELSRFWNAYSGYAGNLRRTPAMGDLFNFAATQLQGPPKPPQLSYMLRGGEF